MIKTRFGAALWIFCLQYFAAEAIAIHAWPGGYSLSRNYISDLGALGCGIHAAGIAGATETLCSPMHAVMNGAFVLQGVLILAGAAMVSSGFSKGVMGVLALVLIGVSGLGVALVGLAPEDVLPKPHFLGAFVNLLCCNAGMALFGATLLQHRGPYSRLGWFSLAFGGLGLGALGLFGAGVDLGLGVGGMERVVAYPFPIWLAFIGASILFVPNLVRPSRAEAPALADEIKSRGFSL